MSNQNRNQSKAAASEEPSELSLEDTIAQNLRGVPAKTRGVVSGYNPYDAGVAAKTPTAAPRKPTDLRKLSEWIRLTREVAELKKQGY